MSGSGSPEFRGYKYIGLHVVRIVITADCNKEANCTRSLTYAGSFVLIV